MNSLGRNFLQRSKCASYLGFARRAGKLTLGVNGVGTLKKGVYLLVADESAQKNSRKEIEKLQKKFSCPLLFVSGLEEMVGKAGCKLAAVRDEGFSKAILGAHPTESICSDEKKRDE